MTEQPGIDYGSRPGISPTEEARALASVYGFLLRRHAEKTAAARCPEPEGGADQTKKAVGKRTES